MIRVDKVAKHFGGRTLFENASLVLEPGARIGLVGANGAGKSTLFKMLSGLMPADEGRIIVPKGTTVGHLQQDVGDIGEQALVEFVLEGRGDVVALRTELEELTEKVSVPNLGHDELVELTDRMGDVGTALELAGGYDLESRAKSILSGMGFLTERFGDPASSLSGGWRVRLVLARLLLQRPTVLLLDEPTNHLDVPSVEWLERFLLDYAGTVVLISHDRYFLNRLVTSIAAFEAGSLYVQLGNFDEYEAGLAERIEMLQKAKDRQDREVAHLERFIERFRSKATKARQVQSRVKKLDKLDRVETAKNQKKVGRFRFAAAPREGKDVVMVRDVAKAYGTNVVYDNLNTSVHRGERIALVGPNGQGKSTLLKLIVREIEADRGEVELGFSVLSAYFGQHQVELLDLKRTVLEEMEDTAPVDEVPRCRSVLGAFLFSGEDVDKKISVLSGGERNRLALAKLLLHPANLLVLDEPTNHLDMDSRDMLLDALREFAGTILFVSHDRYFINGLASRVIHVEGGEAKSYDGAYDHYARMRRAELAAATPTLTSAEKKSKKAARRNDADARKIRNRKTKKKRDLLAKVEARIAELEARSGQISTKLADPDYYASAGPEAAELTREYQALA
ncbi:MAG: ATP-binding cassette subfamily F protein 3, partial [Bradymonadia bacterium]